MEYFTLNNGNKIQNIRVRRKCYDKIALHLRRAWLSFTYQDGEKCMMDEETRNLEYKRADDKFFLKTVSAFANYCDGRIVLNVRDNADVVGVSDPAALVLILRI